MSVEPGTTLSHYRLAELVGEGGMGRVYRAHDLRLDRDVAVKVLLPDTLEDEAARRRFRREALALSKLNHPNIATVYDFDTDCGVDFLVMEFVEGESLGTAIQRGPLPEEDIVRLGVQLASGLAAAHREHVVHRDLKPGNVRITPDRLLKILDFGLAKHVRPPTGTSVTESVTEAGGLVGTFQYMAPEQVRGSAVDERADIWAAGVVLYEMATGNRAFPEIDIGKLLSGILEETPPPARDVNPGVSPALSSVISTCLEKDPNDRCPTALQLRRDLERTREASTIVISRHEPRRRGRRPLFWSAAALVAAVAIVLGLDAGGLRTAIFGKRGEMRYASLAVLPIVNLTGDPSQDYFAEGMTDGLITNLARLGGFERVSGTRSVMQFKGTDKPLSEIAALLQVDAVVQASLMMNAGRVRVTAQLLDARAERLLWADTFEQEMEDVLGVLNDVTRGIADAVRVALSPADEQRLAQKQKVNPQAFEYYLQGCRGLNQWTESSVTGALELFRQSIAIDPGFAPAQAGIAQAYLHLGAVGLQAIPPEEALPAARAAVLRAVSLDPLLPEAHYVLAMIAADYDWDAETAEREFKRCIDLNPSFSPARMQYAVLLSTHFGRVDEAVREAKRAAELDPLDPFAATGPVWRLRDARRFEESIAAGKQVLEKFPGYWIGHWALGFTYMDAGRYDEAVAEFEKAMALSEGNSNALATLAVARARQGEVDKAHAILQDLKDPSRRRHRPAFWIAAIHSTLGEIDSALVWLERTDFPLAPWYEQNILKRAAADPRYPAVKQRALAARAKLR